VLGKRHDGTRECRRLHNEDLYDLYTSLNTTRVIKSRRMRWAGHVARMGDRRGTYRVFVGKLKVKSTLGRSRHRWEDTINKVLQEVGWRHRLHLPSSE